MPAYNRNFELDVSDMELIETALHQQVRDLSSKHIEDQTVDGACPGEKLRDVKELLGRLHNQKIFYRPTTGTYVGG